MILDEIDVTPLEAESTSDNVRKVISVLFWTWYATNTDRKITTVKWWVFRKTLFVRDLESIFELLFGPRNAFA